jgi:NADH-ubiquinone oxidoreductase chain 1
MPLFPIFIIFFIGSVAETNRAPFDLAEAESELVSGFMTEHAAVIFVFFFLAEYGSIVLICILNTMLFLGGYLAPVITDYTFLLYALYEIGYLGTEMFDSPLLEGMLSGLTLGVKSSAMIFIFI